MRTKKGAMFSLTEFTAPQIWRRLGLESVTVYSNKGIDPSDPFKQFSEEVGHGKHIGKDQCPDDDSFNTDLNPSYPRFRFINAENLFSVHLMLLIFQVIFNNLKKSKSTYNDYPNNEEIDRCQLFDQEVFFDLRSRRSFLNKQVPCQIIDWDFDPENNWNLKGI